MPQAFTRVEIKFPDTGELLRRIDGAAASEDKSRSEWIREACEAALKRLAELTP